MGALDGIRVIDAGLLVQGPTAAQTMRDWGASVIKVEMPLFGDQARWLPAAEDDGRSAYFAANNRGKRSITLDLRTDRGRDVFLRLCDDTDVVISNFKSGTMDSWGLGYDVLAGRNPRIIVAAGSTFGTDGPDAGREGADLSAQAAGGLISTTGVTGGDRTPAGVTIADHIASQNLLSGILAALFVRERTGVGQRIDSSLLGGQIWAQASEYTACLLTGRAAGPSNQGHPLIPGIYGIFPTADGWIAIVGIAGDARRVFFELIGRPEMTEQYPQIFYWSQVKREVFAQLDEVFRTRPTSQWCELLRAAGLRHAPVRTHAEVVSDEGAWQNGYFRKVDGSEGEATIVVPPVRFSATPAEPAADVPVLGQHTEEILLEHGFTWDDIAALRDSNTI